jgi:hypothetical protein
MPSLLQASCYGYLFNATLRQFDAERAIGSFCRQFEQVCIATVPSQDDTRDRLAALEAKYANLKVIDTKIQIGGNNRFDGQLKTIAMHFCKLDTRIIIDLDEFIPNTQQQMSAWADLISEMPKLPSFGYCGVMIPVVDLYGSEKTVEAKPFGYKFRIHNELVRERGVPSWAELDNGLFDTSKSDSTEPLMLNGQLAPFYKPALPAIHPNFPYVVHTGYLNLARRAKLSRELWKQAWEERSGKVENVVTDEAELTNKVLAEHHLDLGDYLNQ